MPLSAEKTPPSEEMVAIVFSKDRPLQLEGTLGSFALHCQDAGAVRLRVLYTTSTSFQQTLYEQVMKEHPNVEFVKEGDFRSDVLRLMEGAPHVLFGVDDTVFIREFSLQRLIQMLAKHADSVGVSLRLGRNTRHCYPLNQLQELPEFEAEGPLLRFRWTTAQHDFAYPLELSSSLYRTRDLLPLLNDISFKNPNELEGQMAARAERFRSTHPFLFCAPQSIAFSIPLNRVQDACKNRFGNNPTHAPNRLARTFCEGYRVDANALSKFVPNGCHHEVELPLRQSGPVLPLVSVIMPCYNQAHLLNEAVASVVAQTFTAWELIIVNDGSPDNASDVARELISRYSDRRISLLEKTDEGLPEARNAAIRLAKSEYFLPLDADDRIAPEFLAKAISVLESEPRVGFVYSDIQHFGLLDHLARLPEFDADTIVHTNNIACVCSLIRRAVWEEAGGYNREMRVGYEDWDFWVSCVEKGWQGRRIPEPLFFYRKTKVSKSTRDDQKRESLIARIMLNHRQLYSPERLRRAEAALRGEIGETKPRRVLLAGAHFWPATGNVEELIEAFGRSLVRRGFEVALATSSHADRYFPLRGGMQIISLNASWKRRRKGRPQAELGALIATGQYDACVLIADPLDWVLWSAENVATGSSTRIIALPVVSDKACAKWSRDRHFRSRLSGLLKRFDAIVSTSASGREAELLREQGLPFLNLPIEVEKCVASPRFRESCVGAAWEEVLFSGQTKVALEMPPGASDEATALTTTRGYVEVRNRETAPRVSVIVPTHNRPKMLRQALRSILKQTMRDLEIVVINDAGEDVQEVIRSLRARNIRYIQHKNNQGLAAARNSGLRAARGKWVAYLDDDDLFYPHHLQTLLGFAEAGGHRVVYSDAQRALQKRKWWHYRTVQRDVPFSRDFDYDEILVNNFIPVLCILHGRECLEQAGFFDEALTTHEDWDLWIRMSRQFKFEHLKQVTCEFRAREDGSTMSSSKRADFLRTALLIYEKYKAHTAGNAAVLERQQHLLVQLKAEVERGREQKNRSRAATWWLRAVLARPNS